MEDLLFRVGIPRRDGNLKRGRSGLRRVSNTADTHLREPDSSSTILGRVSLFPDARIRKRTSTNDINFAIEVLCSIADASVS